jgi:hypothetical protein
MDGGQREKDAGGALGFLYLTSTAASRQLPIANNL